MKQGVQVHFLLDTGAMVSILNGETFKAIQHLKLHVLEPLTTNVRAANEAITPFRGIAKVNFKIDNKPIQFKQSFWISTDKDSCKANILGMDWITNHCENMDFKTDKITLRSTHQSMSLLLN